MKDRRFGVIGAMTCIAVIAAGLWMNRLDYPQMSAWRYHLRDPGHYTYATRVAFVALTLAMPHLAVWTVATLGLGLRKPGPGRVASLAAAAVLALILGCFVACRARGHIAQIDVSYCHWMRGPGAFLNYRVGRQVGLLLAPYGDRIGFAVAGAWIALLSSGRWRPEPTWIDRLGIAVGFAWIAAGAATWSLQFIP
jgi:hypothetical protein